MKEPRQLRWSNKRKKREAVGGNFMIKDREERRFQMQLYY